MPYHALALLAQVSPPSDVNGLTAGGIGLAGLVVMAFVKDFIDRRREREKRNHEDWHDERKRLEKALLACQQELREQRDSKHKHANELTPVKVALAICETELAAERKEKERLQRELEAERAENHRLLKAAPPDSE